MIYNEGDKVIFHGIECSVSSKISDNRYRLIAQGGSLEQLEQDASFSLYHMWGAIGMPIACPGCGKDTWVDGAEEKEVQSIKCENCGTNIEV